VESSGYGALRPIKNETEKAFNKRESMQKKNVSKSQYQCLSGVCKKCYFCLNSNNLLKDFTITKR